MSPDQNFVFGGGSNTLGILIGVKPSAGTVNFSGLYYGCGIDIDAAQLTSANFTATDTFYGAANALNGTLYGHKRTFSPLFDALPEAVTYDTSYPTNTPNGSYVDSYFRKQYTFGAGGAIRIGQGIGSLFGISVLFPAPTMSGSGVFLDPNGDVNAADFSPFTQGISGGESIVLYGTGLSSGTATASSLPLPTTLGNVQVLINGIPAPLRYVSPTQLSVVVPFGIYYTPTTGVPAIPSRPIAMIQVMNNGVASNTVYKFINLTTAGVFSNGTKNPHGFDYALVADAMTGQLLNASNPAQPGEIVSVYVSGLGDTSPAGTNGAPPTGLVKTAQTVSASVGGFPTTVTFAGLAPTEVGVYQVNLIIPQVVPPGDNVLVIAGPDSLNQTSVITIGEPTTGSAITGMQPLVPSISGNRAMRPCFIRDPVCGSGIN
jgi:uncharacterized protein (TIGR03437 family)